MTENSEANKRKELVFISLIKYAVAAVAIPLLAGLLFPGGIAYLLTAHHRPTVLVQGTAFSQPDCHLFMVTVGPKYLDKPTEHLDLSMKFSERILSYGYGIDSELKGSNLVLSDDFQVSADCKVKTFSQEPPSYLQMRTPGQEHRILQIESDHLDESSSFMLFVATTPGSNPFPDTSGRAIYTAWGQQLPAPIELIKPKSKVTDVKQLPPLP